MFVIFSRDRGEPWDGGGKFISDTHGVPDSCVKQELSGINRVGGNNIKDTLFELSVLMGTDAFSTRSAAGTGKLWNDNLEACLKASLVVAEEGQKLRNRLVYTINTTTLFTHKEMVRVGGQGVAANRRVKGMRAGSSRVMLTFATSGRNGQAQATHGGITEIKVKEPKIRKK